MSLVDGKPEGSFLSNAHRRITLAWRYANYPGAFETNEQERGSIASRQGIWLNTKKSPVQAGLSQPDWQASPGY